jgi:uncharacterized protein YgbK (DUF1537 family)
MKCLLIADDVTGACDAAVQFRLRGAETRVALTAPTEPCEVLAVSTDSRGLCAAEAAARLQAIAARARHWAPEILFKKIDSLWRGDQAAEIQACRAAFECEEAIVTPAFPAMGRRVVNGCLLVDTLPAWQPLKIDALDASTDGDLRRIVRNGLASGKRILWAGSAGLAGALARELYPRTVLFCIGSDHEVTTAQEAALRAQGTGGYRILRIPWGVMKEAEVRAAIARETTGALLLTGGETAAMVCRAIGATALTLEGEIVTGLPWGHIVGGPYDGIPVATKSGAFGSADALIKVLDFF